MEDRSPYHNALEDAKITHACFNEYMSLINQLEMKS